MLAEITGFPACQPAAQLGRAGRVAGPAGRSASYHEARGEAHRDVCLIPASAHGTNPASAAMAGMRVVVVACDDEGLRRPRRPRGEGEGARRELAALMVTYPSTYGIFEERSSRICAIVHEHGGQVYMDGANLNAQVGLCRPADVGADVCHVNLHKTFCIPHGGGGPGMGPIGVAAHLAKFLPRPPRRARSGGEQGIGAGLARRPWGSASILLISWAYIAHDGRRGAEARQRGRDPERELRGGAPRTRTTRSFYRGQARARRARVHPRHARASSARRASRWTTSPSASWTTASTRRR